MRILGSRSYFWGSDICYLQLLEEKQLEREKGSGEKFTILPITIEFTRSILTISELNSSKPKALYLDLSRQKELCTQISAAL